MSRIFTKQEIKNIAETVLSPPKTGVKGSRSPSIPRTEHKQQKSPSPRRTSSPRRISSPSPPRTNVKNLSRTTSPSRGPKIALKFI